LSAWHAPHQSQMAYMRKRSRLPVVVCDLAK
jgi:hypothetical protein